MTIEDCIEALYRGLEHQIEGLRREADNVDIHAHSGDPHRLDLRALANAVHERTPADTHYLVNRRIGKHIGPFTTRVDALLALAIAEDRANWVAMNRNEFDAYLKSSPNGNRDS